jgi:hypothetical protein
LKEPGALILEHHWLSLGHAVSKIDATQQAGGLDISTGPPSPDRFAFFFAAYRLRIS